MPAPQLTFASETRMRLPMCEQFKGSLMAGGEARTFAAVTCSLQPDYLGLYKNLFFFAQTPSSRAAADKPVIAKIVNSYRVTAGMFKKMIAPYTPMPPASAMHYSAPYEDPTNSDCFDYNVIRESPPWEMPMHCGGWQPGEGEGGVDLNVDPYIIRRRRLRRRRLRARLRTRAPGWVWRRRSLARRRSPRHAASGPVRST